MDFDTFANVASLRPITGTEIFKRLPQEMFNIYDPYPESIVNSKVFSFSLFMKGANTPEWRIQYPTYQMNFMRGLMDDPMWNDYGFIHFFHIDAFMKIYNAARNGEEEVEETNADAENRAENRAIINSIIQLSRIPSTNDARRRRYKLYLYTHPKNIPLFWGTVVRFLPMIMPAVEVVLFRDAHSSTPNYRCDMQFTTRDRSVPCNSLDREWVRLWEAEATKKYMFYTMKGYQPVHALGARRPLAGAWGAKIIEEQTIEDQSILNSEVFYTRLCNLELAMSVVGNNGAYGVDEQLLYYFLTTTPGVQGESIFIGMTWLLYLFYPQTKMEKLTKKKLLTQNTNGSLETVEYCMTASNILPSNNYNNSARCIIFSSIHSFGHAVRREMSPELPEWNQRISTLLVKEVIECMGRARNYANNYTGPDGPHAMMYMQMSSLIPDARNLWDTLFTTSVNLNGTILEYLNVFVLVTANELDNMCDSEAQSVSVMPQFGGNNENKVSKKPKKTQKK
jgi:hypothetical protein